MPPTQTPDAKVARCKAEIDAKVARCKAEIIELLDGLKAARIRYMQFSAAIDALPDWQIIDTAARLRTVAARLLGRPTR